MDPTNFIEAYEQALATQNWKNVDPLVSENASVTFSDGSVHLGKIKIQQAFENNFSKIKNESYKIKHVKWLKKESSFAVYLFEFHWSGFIEEKLVSGKGIGTSVIINENGIWKLLSEHLGKSK